MKVCDLPYKRFTIEQVQEVLEPSIARIIAAQSADEILAIRDEIKNISDEFATMVSLCHTRYCLNTNDEFYLTEKAYYDKVMPIFGEIKSRYAAAILDSKFLPELKERLPETLILNFECARKSQDPRIIEDRQREAEVVTEYSNLMSRMLFDFDGEKIPLTLLRAHFGDKDRDVRKRAMESLGRGLEANKEQLDDIYDRLVHIRDAMAKKLGYKNYVELGYYDMCRIDYDHNMVAKFRDNVRNVVVPVVSKIKTEVAHSLGLDKVMFYDNDVCMADGEPKPIGGKDEIFAAAREMYDEMDPDLGDFMRSMQENEALDVQSRTGKWGGGFATSFGTFRQPFILANFNGSSADIDVMTHEFGHTYAMSKVYDYGDSEVDVGGMETAECHSMSMEFLCWPFIDKFFGNDGDKYRYKHLLESFSFIPYGVIVDEFQHIVYSNPDMTPAERNAVYLELERKYRPYLDYMGIPYLEQGTRWQYQMHIYESPFYYIDYCLAQTIALNFLVESRKDYADALARYKAFAVKGGLKKFSTLVKEAGLVSPFEDGALNKIANEIPDILDTLR